MALVGGHPNKPIWLPIDRIHRAYRAPCIEFANDLGWDQNTIADWFEQFMFMRIKEQGYPRDLAAWMAMRDVRAAFYKPGSIGD